jgi:hypothetical protein
MPTPRTITGRRDAPTGNPDHTRSARCTRRVTLDRVEESTAKAPLSHTDPSTKIEGEDRQLSTSAHPATLEHPKADATAPATGRANLPTPSQPPPVNQQLTRLRSSQD